MPALYSHFYRVVQDLQGNAIREVMGTITLAGSATLATLYADAEGLTPLPNPLVNHPEYGSFSVYLGSGHYDMAFAKEAYVFQPLVDILIPDASGGVIALQGTPNQVYVTSASGNVILSTPQNTDPDASIQFAHLGLGTPASAAHGLVVETLSEFRATMMTNMIVSASQIDAQRFYVPDHAGDTQVAYHSHLNAAGGANRWFFYSGGTAPSYLAGTLTVSGSVTFNGTFSVASNVGVGGTLTVTGSVLSPSWGGFGGGVAAGTTGGPQGGRKLDVWGDMYVSQHTGLGVGPLPGQFHLNCGSANFTSVNTPTLSATTGSFTTVNTGALNASGWITGGEASVAGRVLCYRLGLSGGDPGGTYALYSAGGQHYFNGPVGVQIAPGTGGYGLAASSIYSSNQVYAEGAMNSASLNVRGGSQFASTIGVSYAADPGYWMRIPSIWVDSLRQGAGSVDGNLSVGNNVTAGGTVQGGLGAFGQGAQPGWYLSALNIFSGAGLYVVGASQLNGAVSTASTAQFLGAVAVGNLTPGYEGYSFHVQGPVKMRDQLRIDGIASRPGGGPWTDSNSMQRYKANIVPLRGGLDALLALRERQWDWSPDYPELEARLPGPRVGFVVEEVQEDRPQWVVPGAPGDAPYALQISGFEALTINALREIVARLEALGG